ncbi:MAG: sigma-70 family RNA polymerase sigma factor [Verrucomicrobiota bacterium]|nr:sigma-70 family RNA polymerase sigma factor [Verrucomicrobiota bacterium]
MVRPSTPAVAVAGNRFTTTRWSVVLSSGAEDEHGARDQKALAHLCRTYWQPIFAFICSRGYSEADAQDLTQDFFVNLLEGSLLQRADPSRGRFRSLLLKALQNFLIDAHDKRCAGKRGGGKTFISWDDWMVEAPSKLSLSEQALGSWTAERLFDVRWAATVVGQALQRLREECEDAGRRRVFDTLHPMLSAEPTDVSYIRFSKELNVPATVVKRLLYQMRRRYRQLLRKEVAQTLEDAAEIDEEIRYLCAVIAAAQ